MPYDPTDVRAKLVTPTRESASAPVTDYSAMEYADFSALPSSTDTENRRDWYARGQNIVLCWSEASGDSDFGPRDEPEEHIVITVDEGVSLTVDAPGETVEVPGQRLVVVPPGASRVRVHGTGRVLRLVRATASDLVAQAVNRDSFLEPHLNVPPSTAGPTRSTASGCASTTSPCRPCRGRHSGSTDAAPSW